MLLQVPYDNYDEAPYEAWYGMHPLQLVGGGGKNFGKVLAGGGVRNFYFGEGGCTVAGGEGGVGGVILLGVTKFRRKF